MKEEEIEELKEEEIEELKEQMDEEWKKWNKLKVSTLFLAFFGIIASYTTFLVMDAPLLESALFILPALAMYLGALYLILGPEPLKYDELEDIADFAHLLAQYAWLQVVLQPIKMREEGGDVDYDLRHTEIPCPNCGNKNHWFLGIYNNEVVYRCSGCDVEFPEPWNPLLVEEMEEGAEEFIKTLEEEEEA